MMNGGDNTGYKADMRKPIKPPDQNGVERSRDQQGESESTGKYIKGN
jgi:hypothetical protein